MVLSRPSSNRSASPSLAFLLAEGCWLLVLLALVAPNHMPPWGKQLYYQAFGTSASALQAPQARYASLLRSPMGLIPREEVSLAQPNASPPAAAPPSAPWSDDTINDFLEIAMGSEFGGGDSVRKWQDGLNIQVFGAPTEHDLQTLNAITQELRQLTGLSIALVDQSPNVEIYFAPIAEFAQLEPHYKPRNEGFFWTWGEHGVIDRAKILINSQQTEQVRSHLLREELTQSLGLMNDSYRDINSIFYQGWTQTTAYTPDDRALIQMLYQPNIRPNMTKAEVSQVLRQSGGDSPSSGEIAHKS